jgi:hypothetical protein
MTASKIVRVVYWVGTTQREDLAADYAEAMEIAGRNGLRGEESSVYTC